MYLLDMYTGLLLRLIFKIFDIYSFIASSILQTFLPITKYFVDKKFKSFGIIINGRRPIDIRVINENKFYPRAAIEGILGLLESRMDGDWTNDDLVGLTQIVMASRRQKEILHPLTWALQFFNLQTKTRAFQVGVKHYDDANEAIKSMLDKNLQYTCGYWKTATNLEDAQVAKMELIARKLKLKPNMKVLDIGCGFGTLGYYLAKNYNVSVVGCSVSKEATKYGQKICKGLPVDLRICDYRDVNEKFDRIVSVGMFEHVGAKNHKEFFDVCHRCLKDDGILLLHTIGNGHKSQTTADAWIDKYIFPNSYIPYYLEINKAIEDRWIIEDWHNFGFDYSKTLAAWESNFDKAWPKLSTKYGERFYRMWKIYLQTSQACFLARSLQLWQIVLSKDGLPGGYQAPR